MSSLVTASSARTDFSRPTKSGTIICGNTTMSRSGKTASVVSPRLLDESALPVSACFTSAMGSLDAASATADVSSALSVPVVSVSKPSGFPSVSFTILTS
ncbi:MAG: hypothetical protein ACRYGI_05905 [Janthinobacterium lividum]